ncbi:MAG: outer membrane beta-barrel family protein [Sediminibacterium sp.]
MKKISAVTAILFLLAISPLHAQQPVLKGNISDTAAKQNLEHALITLLRAKDSTLYKFGRADAKGNFEIKNLVPGKYKLVITAPSYADYGDDITVTNNPLIDLGKIGLITKAHLLEDVVVRQQIAAVRLKGDTMEFRADSFKVRAGANIEEMLRTVPGFQVDKDGKITAYGEKIEKVLVDGEEFFGDDPTMATKNLDAAAVDRFQVFDKKSDQAAFTGVDDGQKKKTINFKLKDSYKRGMFGKLEAGGGPDDKWNNSLMANAFKAKRKISFYGIMSSTGKTGLGWEEMSQYGDAAGSSFAVTMMDGNTAMAIGGGGDELGAGQGIPKSWSAGINYSNKFNEDKQSLNGSYKYGKVITEGTGATRAQSILPNNLFFNNQESSSYSDRERNSINASLDLMFDSSFSGKVTVRGYKGTSRTRSLLHTESLDAYGNQVNDGNRVNSSTADEQMLSTSVLLRKRFKKPGRTFSINFDQRYTETNSEGFLFAKNDYYNKTATPFKSDTTDQEKINGRLDKTIGARAVYTEPLTKSLTMELSYGLSQSNSESKLLSYDKSGSGKYDNLNKTYSNSYAYDILTNTAGMTLQYTSKKYQASIGGNVSQADIKQTELIKDSVSKFAYKNFFPRANLTYKFNPNRRLSFNYNGSTRQPTIQQIQPVSDNTNPLNIQIGNPNLRQEFNHSFFMYYNDFKVLKERGINANISYSTTVDAIRNATVTDTLNKTRYQYINIDGNYSYNGRIGYSQKIPKLWAISFNTSYYYTKSVSSSYINGLLNHSHYAAHNLSLGLYKYVDKKFDLNLSHTFSYNLSHSTIRPDVNNNYWNMTTYAGFNVQLPGGFEISQNMSANLRERTAVFTTNNNVINWNAYVAKKISKDKKSEIRFSAFDILDQNKGVNRTTSAVTVTEVTTETLHRYFLLSLVWSFTKNGAGTPAPSPVIMMAK